jgi:chemotaxis protein MotB
LPYSGLADVVASIRADYPSITQINCWKDFAMTITFAKRTLIVLLPAAALAGCVWKSDYDALQAKYDQLQAQNQASQQSIGRLQNSLRLVVNDDLAFKSGSAELSSAGEQTMASIAQQLAPYQTRPIVINGYTDNVPVSAAMQRQGISDNMALSQKRAEAVKGYLAQHGVRPDMMTTKGWGDQGPVASNATPAGRAQNRRVEITFADQGTAALP